MNAEKPLAYYVDRLAEASSLDDAEMMHGLAKERLQEMRVSTSVSANQLIHALEDENYWHRVAVASQLSDKIIRCRIAIAEVDYLLEE